MAGYAKVQPEFAEVGAFSNIRLVREALPDAFLNLRYSPVRLKDVSKPQLAMDIQEMEWRMKFCGCGRRPSMNRS